IVASPSSDIIDKKMNWDTKRYADATKRYTDYFSPKPEVTVPKQIKRTFPALAAIILLLLFLSGSFSNVNSRFWSSTDPRFPRKIWQIWKVGSLDFQIKDLEVAHSWIQKNPTYRYEVLTDDNDMAYVEREYGPDGLNRLDIVHVYKNLNLKIIKADLLRYMVMYVEGGLYTDIDVEAVRPISKFIPERYNERDVDMVIGVEIDEPLFADHPVLGPKCQSFVQWTFMCKPRLPVMMRLIETIMAWLKQVAEEQGVTIAAIQLDFDQVISGTGPSAFTKAILAEMSEREGRDVKWKTFSDMEESKLVGNILVNNVEAFAAGQGHSNAGNHESRHSLIKHHYHASHWPEQHPRFNHPMYGEVERCNWDWNCVKQWDQDTADWQTLPEEEKNRRLAQKEFEDRERAERERIEREREEREQLEREQREQREKEDRARKEQGGLVS
ncbi:glycosyltransferase family 32 protein, partial [Hortaea werneckii]